MPSCPPPSPHVYKRGSFQNCLQWLVCNSVMCLRFFQLSSSHVLVRTENTDLLVPSCPAVVGRQRRSIALRCLLPWEVLFLSFYTAHHWSLDLYVWYSAWSNNVMWQGHLFASSCIARCFTAIQEYWKAGGLEEFQFSFCWYLHILPQLFGWFSNHPLV